MAKFWQNELLRTVMAVLLICLVAADLGDRIEVWATSDVPQHDVEQMHRRVQRQAGEDEPFSGAPTRNLGQRLRMGEIEAAEQQQEQQAQKRAAEGGEHHEFLDDLGAWLTWGWHGALAASNPMIALFTVVLAWTGIRQAKAGMISAEAAKRAAAIAADQARMLLAQEAPLLVFEPRQPGLANQGTLSFIRSAVSTGYRFRNHGRTAAITMHHQVRVGTGPRQEPDVAIRLFHLNRLIVPGEQSEELRLEKKPKLVRQEEDDILAGELELWLIGNIVYRDVYDTERTARFSYTFDREGLLWIEDSSAEEKKAWLDKILAQPAGLGRRPDMTEEGD